MKILVEKLAQFMLEKGYTLSCAESCTGGLASAMITERAGVSTFFCGGIVSYSNAVKEQLLNVPKTIIANYGAVSIQTALAMAIGVQKALCTDCSFAITGVAGPGGASETKPVGTVCFAFCVGANTSSEQVLFTGDRHTIRELAVKHALNQMIVCAS